MLVALPRRLLPAALVSLLAAGVSAADAMASHGALYTQTNDPDGNTVQMFDRAADGTLGPARTFSTGGAGLAGLGGRQGAVELSDDEKTVYAVNAGSNTVTAFRVTRNGLEIADTAGSGGTAPVSVDEQRGRVYVLNSGGTANVTAFEERRGGELAPIGSSDLPGAIGAAQVSVTHDDRTLVVSERVSNRLETLPLDRAGRPGAPVATPSSGAVPFGFAIGHRNDVLVSEAGASTVSSYRIERDGGLRTITPSLPVGFGAACWLAVSPDGRFAYTGNASGSISGFGVATDGSLSSLGATPLVPSPRDLDFARNGRFLYAVSPGGLVTGYRAGSDGSLAQVTSVPAAAGITGARGGLSGLRPLCWLRCMRSRSTRPRPTSHG